jgi:hypothetical protein
MDFQLQAVTDMVREMSQSANLACSDGPALLQDQSWVALRGEARECSCRRPHRRQAASTATGACWTFVLNTATAVWTSSRA